MASSDPAPQLPEVPPGPFTPETARIANERRRQIAKLTASVQAQTRAALERILEQRPELVDGDVGTFARFAAARLAADLANGEVPTKYAHYAARAVRDLVDVARIEAGQPTSLKASVTADAADFRAWLDDVRKGLTPGDDTATEHQPDPDDRAPRPPRVDEG